MVAARTLQSAEVKFLQPDRPICEVAIFKIASVVETYIQVTKIRIIILREIVACIQTDKQACVDGEC